MVSYLPEIGLQDKRYVEVYFKVQLLYAERKETKARRLSGLLTKFTGFGKFEDENESLVAAIDIAVRGKTRRSVPPALNVNHNG